MTGVDLNPFTGRLDLTGSSSGGTDKLVAVSSNDTTPNYLSSKLIGGTNISLVETDDGSNETLVINSSASGSTDLSGGSFIVVQSESTLSGERVLTGTTNQINLNDGGAGGNMTLSLPQNIHTGAYPTFAGLNSTGTISGGALSLGIISGAILYSDSNNLISGSANTLYWDSSLERLKIVNSYSATPNVIWDTGSTGGFSVLGEQVGPSPVIGGAIDDASTRPFFIGRRSRGTLASPSDLQLGDAVFGFLAAGYSNGGWQHASALDFVVDATVTSGSVPMAFVIKTGTNFSTRAEHFRVTSTGDVWITNGISGANAKFSGRISGANVIGTTLISGARIGVNGAFELPTVDGSNGQFLQTDGSGSTSWGTPAGSGDVSGPGSSTDNALARWNGSGGDTIQDSNVIVDDSDYITGSAGFNTSGSISGGTLHASNLISGSRVYVTNNISGGTYTHLSEITDNVSGATTINFRSGNRHRLNLLSGGTLTFTAPLGAASVQMMIVQNSVGNKTVTFPSSVKWIGGTAPSFTTDANAIDVVTCSLVSGGTVYLCTSSLNFS